MKTYLIIMAEFFALLGLMVMIYVIASLLGVYFDMI